MEQRTFPVECIPLTGSLTNLLLDNSAKKKALISFIVLTYTLSALVYPRVFTTNTNMTLKIGQVPPVMDPMVSGDVVLDTEFEVSMVTIHLIQCSFCIHYLQKNSHILKNKNLLYGSQQCLMRCLKSGKLKISELGEYSDEKMSKLCEELGFTSMSR